MAVLGPARILGSVASGWVADIDMRLLFGAGAVLALVAALLSWLVATDPPADSTIRFPASVQNA